jgi:hypothetical protein
MSLIVEGRNLFAMLVTVGGGMDVHQQELRCRDIKNLVDSGLVEVNYGVAVSPGVKLRLKMNEKEIVLMKKIIDSSYKGVPVPEAIVDVPLVRLRELRIRFGLIRTEQRDGKVYLKF